jgi:hypothetical protein
MACSRPRQEGASDVDIEDMVAELSNKLNKVIDGIRARECTRET